MKEQKSEIKISLDNIENNLELYVYGNRKETLYIIDNEIALENGQSIYQIIEGNFYNYYFKLDKKATNKYQLKENIIVKNALREDVSEGRISPNIYVGSLPLTIYNKETNFEFEGIILEVLASKLDDYSIPREDQNYQKNYQYMLKDIAEKCTDLLMQINSPVTQNFEVNFEKNNDTIYQRFAFVNSLINTNEFNESVLKIITSPTTKWLNQLELKDTRSINRISSSSIRQLSSRSNRVKLVKPIGKLFDVPNKIESSQKIETSDTLENRFIKYTLEVFLQFCTECREKFINVGYVKSKIEAEAIVQKLENYLSHPFFKEIKQPTTLRLNSPALQRKSGYREILNAWLQFDLAAKLIWKGGEDVYKAGKRDIAVLYEYWLFFILYELINSKFNLKVSDTANNYGHLIEPTEDGLNLMLKSGKHTALEGTHQSNGRTLHIKFSYNRTFEGGTLYNSKKAGSWTKPLRPDYTLSIWPEEINSEEEAEQLEKIVHIHFDSKYKVQQFAIKTNIENNIIDLEEDSNSSLYNHESKIDTLEKEKRDERKGIYKNADLIKMHAYKDAIRRTGGAYILYPGTNTEEHLNFQGFHELIPGLGAFAIRPKDGENGTSEISNFIDKIIEHFNNMASQHRKHSNKIFEIYRDPSPLIINEPMPDYIIPDETHITVAYYKSKKHLDWIKNEMKYNGRIGDTRGAMELTPEFIGSQYLLLHNKLESGSVLFKINQNEKMKPQVVSASDLKNYPTPPSQQFYLLFNLLEIEADFLLNNYDFKALNKYSEDKYAFPFTCTLSELIQKKIL